MQTTAAFKTAAKRALMKTKTIIIFTIVSAIFLACGCGPKSVDYYPLKVGNEWTFKTTLFPDENVRIDTELIIKREKETYFFDNEEQMAILAGSTLINRDGYTILKSPLKVGKQWNEMGAQMTITALNAKYEVPAGTFSDTVEVTWEIDRPDKDDPNKRYKDIMIYRYAKGIGPIFYYYEVIKPDQTRVRMLQSKLEKFRNVRDDRK